MVGYVDYDASDLGSSVIHLQVNTCCIVTFSIKAKLCALTKLNLWSRNLLTYTGFK